MYTHVVDKGASLQTLGRSSLTARPTEKVYSIQTASAVVEVSREAEVHMKQLNTCVCVKLVVEEYPTVFPLGKLCDEVDYTNIRIPTENPRLTGSGVTSNKSGWAPCC